MYTIKKANRALNIIKRWARKSISNEDYNKALKEISFACVLSYRMNLSFMDDELENMILDISRLLERDIACSEPHKKKIAYYDSFCHIEKGLSRQYLKALYNLDYDVVYITRVRNNDERNVQRIINQEYPRFTLHVLNHGENTTEAIEEIIKVLNLHQVESLFVYGTPWDTTIVTVSHIMNKVKKYYINLTDHAFWLGTKALDVCVEFRNYGFNISRLERKIEADKLFILNFYPYVEDVEFSGYPMGIDKDDIIIFSGGEYSKIHGEPKLYYEAIKQILNIDRRIKILYVGWGVDSGLSEFVNQNKLNKRVILAKPRRDFVHLISRSHIVLGTYPISGGLITQYGAICGKPVVGLINAEMPLSGIVDLVGNKHVLNEYTYDFNDISELCSDITKMIKDESYRNNKGQSLKKALSNDHQFESQLRKLLNSDYEITKIEELAGSNDFYSRHSISYENSKTTNLLLFGFNDIGVRCIVLFPVQSVKTIVKYAMIYLSDRVYKGMSLLTE